MNRKQLLLILIAGVVLGAFGWKLARQKSASFERTNKIESGKLLGDFPVNDVRFINIRQGTNVMHLVKSDVWKVRERSDYPANANMIIEFARKLWDLHAAQSQKIGESQLGRLELLPPDKGGTNSGTLVELNGKDGLLIRSLLLGKKSLQGGGSDPMSGGGWPNGRWVYLPGNPGTAYLTAEVFEQIEPKPQSWLDKDFFHVEKLKSVAVNFPDGTNSWKVFREIENGALKLADIAPGEELDTGRSSGVGSALNSPMFNDVFSQDSKPAETTNEKPVEGVLETFDGFSYAVKLWKLADDNYALTMNVSGNFPKERAAAADEKPEDKARLDKQFKDDELKLEDKLKKESGYTNWIYSINRWTVEPLLKHRFELLKDKPQEKKSSEAETSTSPAPASHDEHAQ